MAHLRCATLGAGAVPGRARPRPGAARREQGRRRLLRRVPAVHSAAEPGDAHARPLRDLRIHVRRRAPRRNAPSDGSLGGDGRRGRLAGNPVRRQRHRVRDARPRRSARDPSRPARELGRDACGRDCDRGSRRRRRGLGFVRDHPRAHRRARLEELGPARTCPRSELRAVRLELELRGHQLPADEDRGPTRRGTNRAVLLADDDARSRLRRALVRRSVLARRAGPRDARVAASSARAPTRAQSARLGRAARPGRSARRRPSRRCGDAGRPRRSATRDDLPALGRGPACPQPGRSGAALHGVELRAGPVATRSGLGPAAQSRGRRALPRGRRARLPGVRDAGTASG